MHLLHIYFNVGVHLPLYFRYANMTDAACHTWEKGGSKMGGWNVCMDFPFKPHDPCVVYSFGSVYSWMLYICQYVQNSVSLLAESVMCMKHCIIFIVSWIMGIINAYNNLLKHNLSNKNYKTKAFAIPLFTNVIFALFKWKVSGFLHKI